MKIVLDTNVLVSGFLSPKGPPGRILDLVVQGEIKLLVDARTVHEYKQVLSRPEWPFSKKDALLALDHILRESIIIEPAPRAVTLPDPDDLMFVEVAVTARASCLVTGNRRHFPRAATGEIPVCSPAEFMQLIGRLGEE